jgi:hypothetical protein
MEGNLNWCREKLNNLRLHIRVVNRQNKGTINLTSEGKEVHADNIFDLEPKISREVVNDFFVFSNTENVVGPTLFANRSLFFG